MPFYQKKGNIPSTRHTQFRNSDNNLFWEELVSRMGFSGIYSNLYHKNPPTAINKIGKLTPYETEIWDTENRPYHFETDRLKSGGNAYNSRMPLMGNNDVIISRANINESMNNFFRNAHYDEVWFIQSGNGVLKTNFGNLDLNFGDYVVIPRGTIWKLIISEEIRTLIIETSGPVETPSNYRNSFGQLLEHSPFCERDIRTPDLKETESEGGNAAVMVRFKEGYQEFNYQNSPFDVSGWDGYFYPWVFNIKDFQPITGKIHQPPPVHQTFQAPGLVICSFVPRLFDYHPDSIPAPYAHSNVDSDEVLFYVKGNFMSRKGIQPESITLHPMGMPHGPQPGKIEDSLGVKETNEMAVMIDTFQPLTLFKALESIDDNSYPLSWSMEEK